MVKRLLYIAGGFAALVLAVLLITQGRAPASKPAMLFAVVALFIIPPLGAFWMIYMSIRYEKRPLPLMALAFLFRSPPCGTTLEGFARGIWEEIAMSLRRNGVCIPGTSFL